MLEMAPRSGKHNTIFFPLSAWKIYHKVIHIIVLIQEKPQPKQKYIQLGMVFNRTHVHDFFILEK